MGSECLVLILIVKKNLYLMTNIECMHDLPNILIRFEMLKCDMIRQFTGATTSSGFGKYHFPSVK
jgi:hypothetical protein